MSDGGVEVVKAESEEVRRELEWLRETFSSSYGPWGGLLLLQGAGGGVATLTRHTPKLLQLIRAENPFSKAVISHLQGHAQTHRDSTLYAGILACNLVLHGLKLQLPRKKVAMEIGHTLSEVVSWLRGGDCKARHRLTFDTVEQLMHLLSSFLGAKLSMLSQQSLQHLCTLLLKAFLRALPEGGGEKSISLSEHIYVVCAPHCPSPYLHPSLLSSLHSGLLLSLEGSPAVSAGRGLGSEVKRTPQGTILTAVFQCSLAGDLPEGSEFNLVGVAGVSVDDVMVEELMAVGHVLVERGVGLVACQKCVHPVLRDYLKAEGVLVLERLSSLLLEPVGALCGAQVLALATPLTVGQARLGMVTELSSICFEGQWYCQLQGGADKHSTLLLCSDSQHSLDDLQFFVRDAMKVFEYCVGEPEVVCGGGCADTVTASYLRTKAKEGSCLPGCELPKVVEMVAECFERQAVALEKHGGRVLTDSVVHHCWIFPPTPCCLQTALCDATRNKTCNCGAVSLSSIPEDATWTALGPDDLMLSPLSPHPAPPPPTVGVSRGVVQSFPKVCDLLTCRVSALTCVAELAQVLLNTAWVLVPHQDN